MEISIPVLLAGAAPGMILWITAIILSAIVLSRGGGKAERLLLAGVILMLTGTVLRIPSAAIVPWFIESGDTIIHATSFAEGYGVLIRIVDMAGIICMAYSFRVKFRINSSTRRY